MLARLLQLEGIDVTVFEGEAAPNYRSQGGTLDLHTDTGLAAMKAAQLWDEFLKYARYDGQYLAIVDKDLDHLFVRHPGNGKEIAGESPEIDRSRLRQILTESVPEGMIRWGSRLKKVEGKTLIFEDSTEAGFDLIVGADGAWSKTRQAVDPNLQPQYVGVGMYHLTIPDAEETAPETCKLVNRGSLFAHSEGQRLTVQQMGDGSLDVHVTFRRDDPDWMKEEKCGIDSTNLEQVKKELLQKDFSGWCPELKDAISSAEGPCVPRSHHILPVGTHWEHVDGLTLIGDAAHLMTPYAGEGVNLALEDAMLLAKAIVNASNGSNTLDDEVRLFENNMFARAKKVQQLSDNLCKDWLFTPGAPRSAPLISNNRRDSEGEFEDEDLASEIGIAQPKSDRPGLFVLALTFAAGISGLLFGYDTGVISATLVSVGTSLSNRSLTSLDKSIITSSTSLFALLISPFSSVLADKLGRKRVMIYADILFLGGALIQAMSNSVLVMTIGRCIVGSAVGAASFVVPLYIAELAPASHRGRLVTLNSVFITGGQVVAYVVGWLFSAFGSKATGWRWMVGLGGLPAAIQFAVVLFMPETPRWLIKEGRMNDARHVIQKVNGSSSSFDIDEVMREIELEAREEELAQNSRPGDRSFLAGWKLLFSEGKHRRALAIACGLQGLQQLCGFNSLMYFSATIFTIVGFSSPTLTSLTVAVTNFIFTIVALGLIDRIGRRRILLYTIPIMTVGLLLSAFGFSFIDLSASTTTQRAEGTGSASHGGIAATIILISIMLYVASYAVGLGNVPWMQSELFPLSVRSKGSGLATATNWGANFVVGLTFLPLMDLLSPSWTFVLYAVVCVAGYVMIWRIYPETAGLSLEAATALLEHGWGVR
ncbi:unnamed protein product, partial [Clonostachys chloroleuca]